MTFRHVLAAVTVLLVASCGGPPPEGETYGSLAELRAAAVAAGLPCPKWVGDNALALAAESGNCSDESVLSTYASHTDLQDQLEQEKENNKLSLALDLETSPILVGPNWLIKASDAAVLKKAMGGVLIGAKKPL